MTQRFGEQIPRIVVGYHGDRFRTIVDVGGGHGNPARLQDRAQVTAGSFFDPLPEGADAYLLCDILHDWDDDYARRILGRCIEAVHPTGRVLVIEPVRGRRANTEIDLAMLVIFGSRDRRIDEFRTLAGAHELALRAPA